MDNGSTTDKAEIIAQLKSTDAFFERVNFDTYSAEELKKFLERWNDDPQTRADKKIRLT